MRQFPGYDALSMINIAILLLTKQREGPPAQVDIAPHVGKTVDRGEHVRIEEFVDEGTCRPHGCLHALGGLFQRRQIEFGE